MKKEMEVKNIKFEGGELLGVKTEDGKICLAVKKACLEIGLTEDQARRQIKNIQEDLVLSKGYTDLSVKFDTQNRKTGFIEEDFVTLWLAKISLTPSMQKKNPDAVQKLITYQLKAAKVLHEAFMRTEEQKQELFNELGLQGEIVELKNEVVSLKNQVNLLIDNSTINSYQAQKLNKEARNRVKTILGGVDSPEYKKKSRTYFKQLWLNLTDRFKITSYKDLNPIDIGNAVNFIKGWSPISTRQ